MEGTIGEIRIFAANFAPMSWAYCNGATLPISSNTALFSILGTNFGGDGRTTFGLPDLQGRAMIGTGEAGGLTAQALGSKGGVETVTIDNSTMPAHIHPVTVVPGAVTADISIKASADQSGVQDPGGNLMGAPNGLGQSIYNVNGSALQPVSMASGSLVVNNVAGPQLTGLQLGIAGSGPSPHENRQPSLVLNYIICTRGVFPTRN